MKINGVRIDSQFAEAFGMKATRVIITAADRHWADRAAAAMTGFATSVIACGIEAGVERRLDRNETPDGRPGVAVLLFAMSGSELEKQLVRRVSQCVLTCPTTALFAGMDTPERLPLGSHLRYFGDGFQISKQIDSRRYWRIPVMDGEFLCEESTGRCPAIGGGNFLVLAKTSAAALAACGVAVEAMENLPDIITPFPGGVARSGSKVGSKYKSLRASTNEQYCPALRGLVSSQLDPDATAALEVVIDGLTEDAIRNAMRVGILALCHSSAASGITSVTAGNYGGKLGQYHFHLHEVLG